ncbi:hypothetical protein GGU11DRAFT_667339, partial [Lentinula aff. detonsa]
MHMTLPEHLPTLCAHNSGNYMRVNNVFCSEDLMEHIMTCDTVPTQRPILTDHIPIGTIINTRTPYVDQQTQWNWAQTDWDKFTERTREELEKLEAPRELNVMAFHKALKMIDDLFIGLRDELVPKAKPSPYQRRWWNKQLTEMKKCMGNLANKSYSKRHDGNHPIHKEFRCIRQAYNAEIKKAKVNKWIEYIKNANTSSVWEIGRLMENGYTD